MSNIKLSIVNNYYDDWGLIKFCNAIFHLSIYGMKEIDRAKLANFLSFARLDPIISNNRSTTNNYINIFQNWIIQSNAGQWNLKLKIHEINLTQLE